MKENSEENFPSYISVYTNENGNNSKIAEIKQKNENGNKPEEDSHLHKVLQNSPYGHFEVNINEEVEGSEKPEQIEDDEIKVKEELEIKEEPIDFTAGNYQCSQYEQEFPQNNTLIKNQIIYTGDKSYQSSHCDKSFSTNSDIITHTTHIDQKPYPCNQCDNAFSHNSSFIIHNRVHIEEKPYQCSQCDKAFSTKKTLINHQRTHSWDKLYQC
ncbi:unnamed protein product, partial [Meganyctiphanes norvegica]